MTQNADEFSSQWIAWRDRVDLATYDARWERLASRGEDIHGEANFICRRLDLDTDPLVMDAGCGSGRVGIEVARRGFSLVGVDNDPDMLALAWPKTDANPELSQRVRWELGNLSTIQIADRFDMVALAGNVLVYAKDDDRQAAISNLVSHLKPGGLFVAGSGSAPGYDPDIHRRWCEAAGLVMLELFATWDEEPYDDGPYAVSVFQNATS